MATFIPNDLVSPKKKVEPNKDQPVAVDHSLSEVIPEESTNTVIEETSEITVTKEEESKDSIDISSENWKEIFDQLKLDPGTKQLLSLIHI